MEFTLKKSTKGKDFILCQNFKYNLKHQNKNGTMYWTFRNCNASITTQENSIIKAMGEPVVEIVDLKEHHLTTCPTVQIEAFDTLTSIKNRVLNDKQIFNFFLYIYW